MLQTFEVDDELFRLTLEHIKITRIEASSFTKYGGYFSL